MTDTYEPNLLDPAIMADLRGEFGRLRDQSSVWRGWAMDGTPAWYVTGAAEVRTVLSDPRFATRQAPQEGVEDPLIRNLTALGIPEDLMVYVTGMLINFSGAEHARLRKLVSYAFTARRVTGLRPRIEEIVDRLLDDIDAAAAGPDPVDLIEAFAYPVPIAVICELVGVPESDRPAWREWGDALVSMSPDRTPHALRSMVEQVKDLVKRRRATPADDLITALLRAQAEDGDRLSDEELVTLVINIVFAGHETTAHQLGNSMAALLTHPDQLALLREQPDRWPGAVHELIRLWTPFPISPLRYTLEEVELGGHTIAAGEAVQPVLISANTDPQVHTDPDRFDVLRRDGERGGANMGFGHGIHYCLGAPLARMETEIALSALFTRFPGLTLQTPPQWAPHPLMVRLAQLPAHPRP